jgi:hypothetical protein
MIKLFWRTLECLVILKKQYLKKSTGALYTGLKRTTYNFYFPEILKTDLLSAYMENTLNDEKVLYGKFLVNNRTKFFSRSSHPTLDRFY